MTRRADAPIGDPAFYWKMVTKGRSREGRASVARVLRERDARWNTSRQLLPPDVWAGLSAAEQQEWLSGRRIG